MLCTRIAGNSYILGHTTAMEVVSLIRTEPAGGQMTLISTAMPLMRLPSPCSSVDHTAQNTALTHDKQCTSFVERGSVHFHHEHDGEVCSFEGLCNDHHGHTDMPFFCNSSAFENGREMQTRGGEGVYSVSEVGLLSHALRERRHARTAPSPFECTRPAAEQTSTQCLP